jgi:hypothetical protein
MNDIPKDELNPFIPIRLQKNQYQANQKNQINPVVLPEKSTSDDNELREKSKENEAFTENEQNKKSQRPIAGDGESRLL